MMLVPFIMVRDDEYHTTFAVEPRLSGPRFSGLFDYPDFLLWSQFCMNINKFKNNSKIVFKTVRCCKNFENCVHHATAIST